jgi:hypothetical protein
MMRWREWLFGAAIAVGAAASVGLLYLITMCIVNVFLPGRAH